MKTKPLFDAGDIVNVDSLSWNYKGKGQIVELRRSINNRPGSLGLWGADILLKDGRVVFVYLHDLAKGNADKLEALQ
jgi:hypothetical protein